MGYRQFAPLLTVLLVLACTLSPTPSSITGVRDLDRHIRQYYAARAQERNFSCNHPLMNIRTARVFAERGDRLTLDVRYFFRQGSSTNTASTCSGSNQRRFVIDTAGGQARIVSMSGGQRP